MNTPEQAQILRPPQAASLCGISLRQLYNIAALDPDFPRKIKFSRRCVGWRRESLENWLKEKEANQ
jgi:predicted DNA-binding transcriptional regulator AlpA